MKKTKTNYYKEIINILKELKSKYSSYSMGKHISTALDDYDDIWFLSDKEIFFAFKKYLAQLEYDIPHETSEFEIERIIKDGLNLSLDTEDEDF